MTQMGSVPVRISVFFSRPLCKHGHTLLAHAPCTTTPAYCNMKSSRVLRVRVIHAVYVLSGRECSIVLVIKQSYSRLGWHQVEVWGEPDLHMMQELLRLKVVLLIPLWGQGNNRTPSITCNATFTSRLQKKLRVLDDLNRVIGDGADVRHLRVVLLGTDNQTELPLTPQITGIVSLCSVFLWVTDTLPC